MGTLSPEEQDVIVSVIKRNEALEVAERQRVGRLVEKLERIKERIVDTGPNQCRLCGHVFRFLRSPKVICEDCRKGVCCKCSIDLIVKRPVNMMTHGGPTMTATTTTTTTTVLVLCKVCSLTREIWKKSGAWFYKGIPKYDLPPAPPQSQAYRRTPLTTTIRLQGNLDSSSDDDSDDDDVFRLFKSRRKGRVLDTTSLVSQESQTTNGSSLLETQSLRSQAMGGGFALGLGNGANGDAESIYSAASCIMVRNSSNDSIREASVGWLEVVLSYNSSEETLVCNVIRARDLRSMDANGLADPLCKLNIVSGDGACRLVNWSRTKTVHKTRNPEFNESISFPGVTEENLLNCWLYIVLLDDDKYGHDFLGTAKVNLAMVRNRWPT